MPDDNEGRLQIIVGGVTQVDIRYESLEMSTDLNGTITFTAQQSDDTPIQRPRLRVVR